MKKVVILAMSIGLVFSATASKTVNVFFAGGQSNAKTEWASALAGGLQAGYGSTLVMVYVNHSGTALNQWYTTTPQTCYSNDFWNASGTAVLQSQIRAITNAGDKVVFQGIFWFQGESDTGTNTGAYATMDAYTNRIGGLIAQVKTDFGFTNNIRFTYAVIDENSDALYDDPANAGGRTRACIDYLRAYQIAQGSQAQFAYVDTRGYTRTDQWHLTTTELTRLGTAMSAAYTTKFGTSLPPDETVYISSHDADGSIYAGGVFSTQDLINGIASGNVMYNGIVFFQLPNRFVSDANLLLTVSSGGTLTNANIDVWALGYMSTPSMSSAWVLQADTDSRILLNSLPPTKIADNLVLVNQAANNGNVFQLNAAQRTNLTAYINALYARGAQPGDYVVIRTNPDAVMNTAVLSNIRFAASSNANTAYRPQLAVTLTTNSVLASGFKYYSHPNDGAIYSSGGYSTVNDLISGTGGTGPQDYCGIAFLPLPEQPMTSSSISLTVNSVSGILTNANIDVWELGYVTVPQMDFGWFCTNNTDSRVLLNGRAPVKLADNIVTSGQTVAVGTVWQPTAAQTNDLKKYLNGLYRKGAKPGDYAVIRVNMDSTQAGIYTGVRWGGSGATSPDRRATLSGAFPAALNYLINDGFEAGSGTVPSIWTVASNGFLGARTNETARDGGYSFRMSVNGNQSGNTNDNLNIYQDVISADFSGKIVTLSGYVRHNSTEPLATNANQKVEFKLQWVYDSSLGATVTCLDPLLPTDPKDVYKAMIIAGTVPSNAIGVRAQVVFSTGTVANPAVTNGAALVDDLRLTVFVPPPPTGSLMLFR